LWLHNPWLTSSITSRSRGRALAGDINIHNDACNPVNASGSEFGISLNRIVTNAAGEFNDPVVYLDANGTGNNIWLTIKLSKDVLLHLHIVLHQAVPLFLTKEHGACAPLRSERARIEVFWGDNRESSGFPLSDDRATSRQRLPT
jgi:hypothetical protein